VAERYRVAIVTRSFPPKSGGIASAHYNLFQLLRADHDVKAFAFDDENAPAPDAVGRKSSRAAASVLERALTAYIHRFEPRARVVYCKSIASISPAARSLSGPLAAFHPDIVIVPDNYAPALAMKFPKRSSVVWMSRNNYKRMENQPLVHSRSWMDIHLAHRLELRGLRKAHHVICPSRYMERVFRDTYPIDIPIDVIYNFVHPATLDAVSAVNLKSRMGMKPDQPLVYIPSAGSPVKGKRYVFEIIRRLGGEGSAGFYLSGEITSDLARELSSLDSRFAVFAPGHLSYAENLAHVAACDFAVSPTLIENLSNAIVEGLMLGLPFVTFDTGGNAEIVHSGVNGFVVPYLDVEALVARSLELVEDSGLRARMRAQSRAPIASMLDPEHLRAQYQAVFDRLRGARAGT
jgi:glycosyltransferase involved in cell wall biosynthesis